jgi:TRAP-type C4-dicarboxylate transport system permease large subunit
MLSRKRVPPRLARADTARVRGSGAVACALGFIIYGAMVEQSVERLFIGGVLPGILMALVFMAYIWVRVAVSPGLVPPSEERSGCSSPS